MTEVQKKQPVTKPAVMRCVGFWINFRFPQEFQPSLLRLQACLFVCRDRDCDLCRFMYPVIGWVTAGPVVPKGPFA